MSYANLGEIRLFAGFYAPADWMFCRGQSLAIADYSSLFSLLGDTYGGDGRTTFRLPDLSARIPVGYSQATPPGMTKSYGIGKAGGRFTSTLSVDELPVHRHAWFASTGPANTPTPSPSVTLATASGGATLYSHSANPTPLDLDPQMCGPAGMGAAHDNTMPSAVIHYIICVRSQYFPVFE